MSGDDGYLAAEPRLLEGQRVRVVEFSPDRVEVRFWDWPGRLVLNRSYEYRLAGRGTRRVEAPPVTESRLMRFCEKTITGVETTDDGCLSVEFASGGTLRALGADGGDAWSLRVPTPDDPVWRFFPSLE